MVNGMERRTAVRNLEIRRDMARLVGKRYGQAIDDASEWFASGVEKALEEIREQVVSATAEHRSPSM